MRRRRRNTISDFEFSFPERSQLFMGKMQTSFLANSAAHLSVMLGLDLP
ncbi:hypothetical protein [Rhizobium sp. NXC14]|nr:hypothetical protein [Rhizobium sp. NXC14]